jgi:hypothetical protein
MSEIAIVQHDYETMWKLSQRVSNTVFVPTALRGKNESVLACIMYGAELGLGPMQALNSIHVIEGRTAMSPELMRAMVARHGHRIDVVENSNTVCEVKGIRADTGSTATVRWTMEDAKMAGLANKNNWKTYPRAMLLARATSELCRIVFPDIIAGLSYTPEEVSSIEGVEYFPETTIAETAKVEEPAAEEIEIIDAEIVEKPVPKKKKVGEKAEFVELADIVDKVIPTSPVENTSPPFEFRLRQVESWGGWPYVKAIAKVAAKKIGVEEPISAYELAHSEKLYKEVKMAINSKK